MPSTNSVSIDDIVGTLPTPSRETVDLDLDGFRVRLFTDSERLAAQLRDYYQHFRGGGQPAVVIHAFDGTDITVPGNWREKPREADKQRVKEHVLALTDGHMVHKLKTGLYLAHGESRTVCFGPLSDHPNQVINFINNLHLDALLADDGQLFHSAAVCRGPLGVGLSGASGQGKSTLALHLLARGADFVSNDRLVVRQAGQRLAMHGIIKYPRINPGTLINQPELVSLASAADLARYRALTPDELWDLEEKYDAPVEPVFGVRFMPAGNLTAFVILNWNRHSQAPCRLVRTTPMAASGLIETVMKTPGVLLPRATARIGNPSVADYVRLLDQCELYLLEGGVDFRAASHQINQLLTGDPLRN